MLQMFICKPGSEGPGNHMGNKGVSLTATREKMRLGLALHRHCIHKYEQQTQKCNFGPIYALINKQNLHPDPTLATGAKHGTHVLLQILRVKNTKGRGPGHGELRP